MLQLIFISVAHSWFPGFSNVVAWNTQGFLYVLLFHVGVVEVLYYWIHRAFHTEVLFRNYHFYHHMSVVPEPPTGMKTLRFIDLTLLILVFVINFAIRNKSEQLVNVRRCWQGQ